MRIEGTLEDPRIDLGVIILDRFALPGWSELRAKIHLALAGDELRVDRLWIADQLGELAMVEARIPISLDDPPDGLPAFLRSLAAHPWSIGARIAPRLLESWPRPLSRHGPPGVLGALAQVSAIRDSNDEAHRYLHEALELAFASGAHELLHSLEDLKKSIAV